MNLSNFSSLLGSLSGRGAAVCAVLLAGACARQLPPAATPDPIAPAIAGAAPAGQSRLVVDVVDGPTQVRRVRMAPIAVADNDGQVRYQFSEVHEPLCDASPCVVDLTPGNVLLGFPVSGDEQALEVELVHVGPESSVYRRALSERQGNGGGMYVLGIVGTSIGGMSMMTGTALLPIGLAKDVDGLTTAGAISLGAGAALVTAGILAIYHDAPTYRPGAAIHFPLATDQAP